MTTENQFSAKYLAVIENQLEIYNRGRRIETCRQIPPTKAIPIEDPSHWLKIPDVVCVFVDMKGSTQLSATDHDESTAGAYQLFTGTAVRLFDAFETPYIDVRGDGVFGMALHRNSLGPGF